VVFTTVWLAADNGLFAKYGLDVTLTDNLEGVKQAQAIIAGDVQIGNVGGTEILNSRVGGSNLIALMQTTESPLFEIHAAPTYKDVKELKGKTVAVTQTGSSTDIAARLMLKNAGLDPNSDVKLLNASNMPGILAAMVSKQVDAGVVSPPTTVKATQQGFPTLASAVNEKLPLQNNLVATTRAYADQHPEVISAYLHAMLDADQMFVSQPDVAVKAIAKHTDSDQPTAQAAYDALKPALDPKGLVDEAGLKTVQQFGPNPQTQSLKLADAYDNHFLQQLLGS